MFSLQPSDELVFGASNPSKGFEIPQDLMMDDTSLTQSTNFINFSSERRVMSPTMNSAGLTRVETHEKESNMRRVLHRDIERKRRREMSNLHLTLSSLLPTEFKKGKRAVCDEMQEAANYIKSMQNKIQELRTRREKLTKVSNLLSANNKVVSCDNQCVTINQLPDGVEILIKTHLYYGLSRALEVLTERELDVVNCVSTRTDEGFLHKIQIQARDMKSLDVSVLQEILS